MQGREPGQLAALLAQPTADFIRHTMYRIVHSGTHQGIVKTLGDNPVPA
jgi:hypothetical protein